VKFDHISPSFPGGDWRQIGRVKDATAATAVAAAAAAMRIAPEKKRTGSAPVVLPVLPSPFRGSGDGGDSASYFTSKKGNLGGTVVYVRT